MSTVENTTSCINGSVSIMCWLILLTRGETYAYINNEKENDTNIKYQACIRGWQMQSKKMNEHNIVGIIPARGGSKGLPHKNIKILAGKPLIVYTIEAALHSKKLNRVIVSTEDKEIADVSREYGTEVIMRPQDLAEDTTPTELVIKHVVSALETEGYKADIIVTLQPTSPFRTSTQIDDAINNIYFDNVDSVISLKEVNEHPYKMKKIENDSVLPFLKIKLQSNRRQDMPTLYIENGAIYITKYDLLMNEDKIIGWNARPFLMSGETSIDIDTGLDFKVADCLLGDNK